MKRLLVLAALLAAFSTYMPSDLVAQTASGGHNYEFANGNWFDGQKFVRRTFYSVAGVLSSKRPLRVDRVFDHTHLSGHFVSGIFDHLFAHNCSFSDAPCAGVVIRTE